MHQTRQEAPVRWPIPRKGTKYIAKPFSHKNESVPVVIAVRDMLKLAQTAREVRSMIKNSALKINGRIVKDYRESIKLFNIIEAGKHFRLTIIPTGKFSFEEIPSSSPRLCKVINKKLVAKNTIQINLHDGSNVISKDKIKVGDSVYLDSTGKIKSHVALEKGKKAFVIAGKYSGKKGLIKEVKNGKILIDFEENGGSSELPANNIIAL